MPSSRRWAMARETFIDSLRLASRMLPPPKVKSGLGPQKDSYLSSLIDSSDLWLTERSIAGFDPADFEDWPEEDRDKLAEEVAAFRAIAERVPSDKPASKTQSAQARRHLEGAIKIVRRHLLHEWLEAQKRMMEEATAAATSNGWYVERDEKEVLESLLGAYKAPRLRIRAQDREVVLDPIACFGSGRRGVVDLVVMPTYETAYLITFKNGHWQIVSPNAKGSPKSRPFTRRSFVSTISRLPIH
jgi:hypothetical protein